MAFHAVILDAGSTGTRAFVYRVAPRGSGQEGRVSEILPRDRKEIISGDKKGIHELRSLDDVATHLGGIFSALTPLLAGSGLPKKLYLLATAGVRDNITQAQRATLSELLTKYLDENQVILDFGFAFKTYRPISGTDEAKYGWTAANYLEKAHHGYKAGYVEMGGASAQIAFPLPTAYHGIAKGVVKKLNLEKILEMVLEHNTAKLNRIRERREVKRKAEEEGKTDKVDKLWIEEEKTLVALWGGDIAKLGAEVDDGGLGALATLWECELAQLKEVAGRQMSNKAILEDMDQRKMFLASYPLGVKTGYTSYIQTLFSARQEGIRVPANGNDFYDPSKRDGYEVEVAGGPFIKGIPTDKSTHLLIHNLAGDAHSKLFSEENVLAAQALDPVVQNLSFLGGANFWWHMGAPADQQKDFRLSTFFGRMKARRGLSHKEFHEKYIKPDMEQWKVNVFDNEIFLARWAQHTLVQAFGFDLTAVGGKKDLKVTFTPYNGTDGKRFSWTHGTAVLLAWDVTHLA